MRYLERIERRVYLIKRSVKHFFQKLKYGYSDRETWSLDMTIAKFVLPRLKRYKEIDPGNPHGLTEREWDEILDEIIYAMEICSDEDSLTKHDIDWDRVYNGLELFGKWFRALWW